VAFSFAERVMRANKSEEREHKALSDDSSPRNIDPG